jgi:hypothetical protein
MRSEVLFQARHSFLRSEKSAAARRPPPLWASTIIEPALPPHAIGIETSSDTAESARSEADLRSVAVDRRHRDFSCAARSLPRPLTASRPVRLWPLLHTPQSGCLLLRIDRTRTTDCRRRAS